MLTTLGGVIFRRCMFFGAETRKLSRLVEEALSLLFEAESELVVGEYGHQGINDLKTTYEKT